MLPRAGERARGWLVAGPLRFACALGPSGIVRDKREGDGATPAGRFRLLWGYYRPELRRPPAGGVPLAPLRRDQGWCEDPASGALQSPRPPARPPTARTACGATIRSTTSSSSSTTISPERRKGRGSAIFFHLARPGLTPTAGCVAISAADMRKLAPRLARGATLRVG